MTGLPAVDLDRPTPCTEWNLGDLLRHMEGENHGFAAAADPPAQRSIRYGGAISMHLVDCLVHGWDVAMSIDTCYRPDPELVASAPAVASRWPDTPKSRGPGTAFDTRVPVPAASPGVQRLLGLPGRDPSWAAPC